MTQRTQALAWLNIALADPALIPGIRAECPALDALLALIPASDDDDAERGNHPVGLPARHELTSLQISVFENPKGFGAQIETWIEDGPATVKSRRNSFSVKLYSHRAFRTYIKRSRAKGLSAEWRAEMEAMLEHDTDYLYGPVYTTANGVGFQYLEGQFVMVKRTEHGLGEAMLFTPGNVLQIEPSWWTQVSHMGRQLHPRCVGSARLDMTGASPDWDTSDGAIIRNSSVA